MSFNFKRLHLRAPLKTSALYLVDDFALKGSILNISEGGLLLENLPSVPDIKAIPLMFPLIDYPEFSLLHPEVLLGLKVLFLEKKIVRMKARIVRSFEGFSDVDRVFVTKIGCEFVSSSDKCKEYISDYVARYAKNLIYFLGLFEGRGQKADRNKLLRKTAGLLGYDSEMQIAQMRLKALHDYQSLEST